MGRAWALPAKALDRAPNAGVVASRRQARRLKGVLKLGHRLGAQDVAMRRARASQIVGHVDRQSVQNIGLQPFAERACVQGMDAPRGRGLGGEQRQMGGFRDFGSGKRVLRRGKGLERGWGLQCAAAHWIHAGEILRRVTRLPEVNS